MVFKKLLKGKKDVDGDGSSTSAEAAAEELVGIWRAKGQAIGSGLHSYPCLGTCRPMQILYHPDADEAGGLLCTNDELLKQQRE